MMSEDEDMDRNDELFGEEEHEDEKNVDEQERLVEPSEWDENEEIMKESEDEEFKPVPGGKQPHGRQGGQKKKNRRRSRR